NRRRGVRYRATPAIGNIHGEHRPLAFYRADADPMAEHARDLFRDGQAQPQTLVPGLGGRLNAFEFLEDLFQLVLGDPHAGIPDLYAQPVDMAATPQQNPAVLRVADRIGQEVAQNPCQQLDIAVHHALATGKTKLQLLAGAYLPVLIGQIIQQLGNVEGADIRPDNPGIQLGNIHQRTEQILDIFQRLVDLPGERVARRRHRQLLTV